MLLRWCRRVVVFFLLILYRWKRHDDFVKKITKSCKSRRKLVTIDDINADLEEITTTPKDCTDELTFVCFNRDGFVLSARTQSADDNHKYDLVTLDIPGTGRFCSVSDRGQIRLKLEMQEALTVWKITFRGMMTKLSTDEKTGDPLYVTVVLYWRCNANPFDHWTCVPSWSLAKCLDGVPFGFNMFEEVSCANFVFYEQWGDVNGSIVVEDQPVIKVEGWKCAKARIIEEHRTGKEPLYDGILAQYVYVNKDGTKLSMGQLLKNKTTQRKYGYLTFPIGETWPLDSSTSGNESKTAPGFDDDCVASIACSMDFNVRKEKGRICIDNENLGERSSFEFIQFNVNGNLAYGVRYKRIGLRNESQKSKQKESISFNIPQSQVVDLYKAGPFSTQTVGGKASKLSILAQKGFNVPKAMCITTQCFQHQLTSNETLHKAIDNIECALRQGRPESLKDICANAVEICLKSTMTEDLENTIQRNLQTIFGASFDSIPFAVRSSGFQEDGQAVSFAGQLETYLGVCGVSGIYDAIRKCWASSLSFRAVEYRRQMGQPLIDPIGVIVQEMVDATMAGVLFTHHPYTGNPSRIVINAAFGLGETVVSGETTPDTVIVKRSDQDQNLVVEEKVIGDKGVQLHLASGGGTDKRQTNAENGKHLCLEEDDIINLSRLGIRIESIFEQEQDIEWAIRDNEIFVLQARPITSIDVESDQDSSTEFDSPCFGEKDCITRANTGEVLPGTASPLSMSIFKMCLNIGYSYMGEITTTTVHPKLADFILCVNKYQYFANGTTFSLICNTLPGVSKGDIEICIVGELIPEHADDAISSLEGRRKSFLTKVKGTIWHFFVELQRQPKRFDVLASNIDQVVVGEGCHDSASLYEAIDADAFRLVDVWRTYSYKVTQSSTWQSVMMNMLKEKDGSLSTRGNADMALLLSECKHIESVDVPVALKQLAREVRESEITDQFLNSTDEQCHSLLLQTANDVLRSHYDAFMKKHGHRCLREMEMASKSWDMEPSLLMHQLKLITKTDNIATTTKDNALTIDEAVDQLQTPLTRFQKYLLKKFLVQKARDGVRARESGKSITVKTQYVLKKAYWRLAEMMVKEGLLPEQELMFFLTHQEIGTLIDQRQPALVLRAKRRRRVQALLQDIRFPVNCIVRPTPIEEVPRTSSLALKSVSGVPVGRGVATGRACVIRSVAEADFIQKGDILICSFTDIGWTPYFPLLAGVATELGGLISHGAVVAREFGLPCIVRATDATFVFKTGDRVRIDGMKGVLEVIED